MKKCTEYNLMLKNCLGYKVIRLTKHLALVRHWSINGKLLRCRIPLYIIRIVDTSLNSYVD